VFEAYTKPELAKRWLGVFGDWTLPECEIDLRVGGNIRYLWRSADGAQMGIRGVIRELVVPERIASTEHFDEPWHEGDAIATITFVDQGGKTTPTMTMEYVSKAVRDARFADGDRSGGELRQAGRDSREVGLKPASTARPRNHETPAIPNSVGARR
jgi:uncharacterized protein YndB with AHSA1/START domain